MVKGQALLEYAYESGWVAFYNLLGLLCALRLTVHRAPYCSPGDADGQHIAPGMREREYPAAFALVDTLP